MSTQVCESGPEKWDPIQRKTKNLMKIHAQIFINPFPNTPKKVKL